MDNHPTARFDVGRLFGRRGTALGDYAIIAGRQIEGAAISTCDDGRPATVDPNA
jgi:hypothetical protein